MATEQHLTAREAVTMAREWARMVRDGSGWAVDVWCAGRDVYVRGPSTSYTIARRMVTEARHAAALVKLGWSWQEAEMESERGSGSLTERIRASLNV